MNRCHYLPAGGDLGGILRYGIVIAHGLPKAVGDAVRECSCMRTPKIDLPLHIRVVCRSESDTPNKK